MGSSAPLRQSRAGPRKAASSSSPSNPATSWHDLRGKRLGYINTYCTTSFFSPSILLARAGFALKDYFDAFPVAPWQGQMAVDAGFKVVIAAGVRVLTRKQLAKSRRLAVVADVNAVPPSGIVGVELFDRGRLLDGSGVASIGPLAIGDVKYKTQAALFRSMLASRDSVMLDFTHAFAKARKLVRGLGVGRVRS
ncbi:MAG TPA: hypothetical protein VIG38_05120 [Hyphomicrobium sp.]|jgi:hypothetical protein